MDSITKSSTLIEQVKYHHLTGIIKSKSHIIIDVRDKKSILDQGSIPDSVPITYESIQAGRKEAMDRIEWLIKEGKPLLFCCTGGVMSYLAAMKVKDKGLGPVCNLEGGHSAWIKSKAVH